MPKAAGGAVFAVYSSSGLFLGSGYFNARSQIAGRMLTFDERPYEQAIGDHIGEAIALRRALYGTSTNAVRLINAEGDFLPGLIVDQYDEALVLQIATLGMERCKPCILSELVKRLQPRWIYEHSTSSARKAEGLGPHTETLYGMPCEPLCIHEEGIRFCVSPTQGQKTGFFLDLREMRKLVRSLSSGRRVLNCFAYTGAFSCHALAGGAREVTSVDISARAIAALEENMRLNGYEAARHTSHVADVFEFLRAQEELPYDLVILDPPAFAKNRAHVPQAKKGYRDINRLALQKMPRGALLLTCSCSYHISEQLFTTILFEAARAAGRNVRLLQSLRLGFDHPLSIYHPEGAYLKAMLVYVS